MGRRQDEIAIGIGRLWLLSQTPVRHCLKSLPAQAKAPQLMAGSTVATLAVAGGGAVAGGAG